MFVSFICQSSNMKIIKVIKNEKGTAILETAMLLPFLVICSLGLFDVGRWFHSYLMISEIAREAATQGAKIPGLKGNATNSFFDHQLNVPTLDDGTIETMGGHEVIRSRIRIARSLLAEAIPVPITDITSQSQCVRDPSLDLVAGDGTGRAVRVRVEAVYGSFFTRFLRGVPNLTIRAEEVVSYLGGVPCEP